jgi:hypothetical protein
VDLLCGMVNPKGDGQLPWALDLARENLTVSCVNSRIHTCLLLFLGSVLRSTCLVILVGVRSM